MPDLPGGISSHAGFLKCKKDGEPLMKWTLRHIAALMLILGSCLTYSVIRIAQEIGTTAVEGYGFDADRENPLANVV